MFIHAYIFSAIIYCLELRYFISVSRITEPQLQEDDSGGDDVVGCWKSGSFCSHVFERLAAQFIQIM